MEKVIKNLMFATMLCSFVTAQSETASPFVVPKKVKKSKKSCSELLINDLPRSASAIESLAQAQKIGFELVLNDPELNEEQAQRVQECCKKLQVLEQTAQELVNVLRAIEIN